MKKRGIRPEIPAQDVTHANLLKIVGKTIKEIEYGFDKPFRSNTHESEAMVLHFTDGSALTIQIGSNAMNISNAHPPIKTNDFHADLIAMLQEA